MESSKNPNHKKSNSSDKKIVTTTPKIKVSK